MIKIVFCLISLILGGINGEHMISRKNLKPSSNNARSYIAEITPHANTNWGNWGIAAFCPDGSFARDFELKIEPSQGSHDDDTAMNAIKIWCYYHFDTDEFEAGIETSTEGGWGSWTGKVSCGDAGAFLKGAQFKSETSQGSHDDDTAGNSVNMECTDGSILEPNGGGWGSWSNWVMCPDNTAICGLKTQVEPSQGSHDDDTALNGVTFYCCEFPTS